VKGSTSGLVGCCSAQIDPFSASFLRADIRPQKAVETNENNQQNLTKVYTMS
jgi:hypothetical protein